MRSAEMDAFVARVREATDILGVVTDNSAVSEECAASSTELSNFSDSLKESVNKFRTN